MNRVDVHILMHPGQDRSATLEPLLEQLEREPVTVHLIPGKLRDIGAARAEGFRAGEGPLVSYVDDDDEIVEGVYTKVLECFNSEPAIDGCATRELHFRHGAREGLVKQFIFKYYNKYNAGDVHHVTTWKREAIGPYLNDISRINTNSEQHLTGLLLRDGARIRHIPFVGYVWREHAGSTPSLNMTRHPDTVALFKELVLTSHANKHRPHIAEQGIIKVNKTRG